MDSLSLVFGGEEPWRGNRSLFLRHCKGHLREEEETETSCEAFQPVSRLELFCLNSLPAEWFPAGEQRLCREGIFPHGLNALALTVPGPKPVLSCAAWWFHGETRGLKHGNQVVCFAQAFLCAFCIHLSHGAERLLCFRHYAIP